MSTYRGVVGKLRPELPLRVEARGRGEAGLRKAADILIEQQYHTVAPERTARKGQIRLASGFLEAVLQGTREFHKNRCS